MARLKAKQETSWGSSSGVFCYPAEMGNLFGFGVSA
jgi:hypothetical protein